MKFRNLLKTYKVPVDAIKDEAIQAKLQAADKANGTSDPKTLEATEALNLTHRYRSFVNRYLEETGESFPISMSGLQSAVQAYNDGAFENIMNHRGQSLDWEAFEKVNQPHLSTRGILDPKDFDDATLSPAEFKKAVRNVRYWIRIENLGIFGYLFGGAFVKAANFVIGTFGVLAGAWTFFFMYMQEPITGTLKTIYHLHTKSETKDPWLVRASRYVFNPLARFSEWTASTFAPKITRLLHGKNPFKKS